MGSVRYLHPGASEPAESKVRDRVTGVQAVLLELMLDEGPLTPRSKLRKRTCLALVEKGMVHNKPDGTYIITPLGEDMLNQKMGRPAKDENALLEGDWLRLIQHYGGVKAFATAAERSQSTIWRWAEGRCEEPTSSALLIVQLLAEKANLPDPFRHIRKRAEARIIAFTKKLAKKAAR